MRETKIKVLLFSIKRQQLGKSTFTGLLTAYMYFNILSVIHTMYTNKVRSNMQNKNEQHCIPHKAMLLFYPQSFSGT